MAVKYGEFKFPSDKGFTGSAGKTMVKAYARGGCVMKAGGGGVKGPYDNRSSLKNEAADLDSEASSLEARGHAAGARAARGAAGMNRRMLDTDNRLRDAMGGQRKMAKGGKVHEDEAMDRALLKKMVKPTAMKAKGGAMHEDEAEDKKLIERMVKPAARKARGGRACG